jgi:hypothetical protein
LAADGREYALSGKQSQKTLKFNGILFVKIESVKMSDDEHIARASFITPRG